MPVTGDSHYVNIVTAIKDRVESAIGWRYVDNSKWINFELGIFPESLKNQSYTIKLNGVELSEIDNLTDVVKVSIEFCLDTLHDQHLKYIYKAQKAMEDIKELSSDDIVQMRGWENYRDFTAQFFFDKVLLTFNVDLICTVHHPNPAP